MLKLIIYDLKQGFLANILKFLIIMAFVLLFCISFRSFAIPAHGHVSFGDYCIQILEGERQVINWTNPEEAKLFNPPVEWLIIQFVIAFATGSYAMEDLNTYGRQILLRSRTRLRWWISKCMWATLTAVFCYIVLYATVAIGAFISGDSLSPMVNEELVLRGDLRTVNIGLNKTEFMISLYLMPVVVSVVISMIQMFMNLYLKPVKAFAIIFGYIALAPFFRSKLLLGNFSMFAKNAINGVTDINCYEGMIICGVVYIVMFAVGTVYFNRKDII